MFDRIDLEDRFDTRLLRVRSSGFTLEWISIEDGGGSSRWAFATRPAPPAVTAVACAESR
ncbi:hypothetical protein BB347_10165 [Natronorubrum daqingense]|uniref:Uncharacterized protein n=1 Tax=Natronorubrum daqingense TaxID=588898 RepID=A0A1P8REF0_9EURY|nr:hypothetical protein BB347_10165 [Natronorubrum daqingense]